MRISDWSSDVCSSDLEAADIEIEAMAENFDRAQLLAIHLKIKCAANQVVGGSFAPFFDRIEKIGLHGAHASSAIVYVGRMDQRDRKSGVEGKSGAVRVFLGGCRFIKKKTKKKK